MASLRLISKFASIKPSNPTNVLFGQARFISASQLKMNKERMYLKVSYKDDIAVIKIDSPNEKVNTLNRAMMPEFVDAFGEVSRNEKVKGVVLISGKTSGFVAGADIRMIDSCKTKEEIYELSRTGQRIMDEMERSKKPIVAAIMGPALGGGLEIALASHYRIAVNDSKTQVGLPEVMLGLLPGSGGTQRLPRLIGIPNALDIALTGKKVKAKKAKQLGIIDQLVEPLGPGITTPDERTLQYLEDVAIQTAKTLAKTGVPAKKPSLQRKLMDKAFEYGFMRNYVFNQAKAKVMGQTKGLYPAPLKILEVVRTGIEQGPEAGYEAEAKGFAELGMTNESKALISLFYGHTSCKKNRFGNPKQEVKNIGVLGAGLMGAGIAAVSIERGLSVVLKDMNQKGLTRGYNQIAKHLNTAVKKKKYSQIEADKIISHLTPQITDKNFGTLDMVIEAVFEDINVKHKVIKEVEKLIPPHCIFATNTSAIPIHEIAKASSRPEKVVGMHYFSPVEKMELLEIIATEKTSQDTIASAVQVGLNQGKVVIVAKDGPGFYTTRILFFTSVELFKLIREGVCPKMIDKATKSFGFPVGHAALIDEVGIDVSSHIAEFMCAQFKERTADFHESLGICTGLVPLGFTGRKAGKGVYLYEEGVKGKDRPINPGFTSHVAKFLVKPPAGITNDIETIQWRFAAKFINEAILCLQEGIINSPIEGDIGAVFGLGFPPMKGGPFKFVDLYGADKVLDKLKRFEQFYGINFKPCQMLVDYAASNRKFYSST